MKANAEHQTDQYQNEKIKSCPILFISIFILILFLIFYPDNLLKKSKEGTENIIFLIINFNTVLVLKNGVENFKKYNFFLKNHRNKKNGV